MKPLLVYPAGSTKACQFAAIFLKNAGASIVDHPTPEITHLLLDVPSFDASGMLRGGGDIAELLRMLPEDLTVVGGKLSHPALRPFQTMDLLQDAEYLAANAAITAQCALRIAMEHMELTFPDSPALIIGWGRIGKCLARLLRSVGADVTVAARKETDRAMLQALGYRAVNLADIPAHMPEFRLIYNTAPAKILPREVTALCGNCVMIDLASAPGIEGDGVIQARGLPGIYAPESSGKLIAKIFLKQYKEGTT